MVDSFDRFDGFVHDNDPPKTHLFNFLIRELFPNKTSNVRIQLYEFHLDRLIADLLGTAIVIREEQTLQNSDFVRAGNGRFEVLGTNNQLPVRLFNPITFLFRPRDPLLTGRRLTERNSEVNDAIYFTMAFGRQNVYSNKLLIHKHLLRTQLCDFCFLSSEPNPGF